MLLTRGSASFGVTAVVAAAALTAVGLAPYPAAAAQAPGFTLDLFSGGTLSLDNLKGSPAILLFWAPW